MGYLPRPGDVEAVELALPREELLPVGPDWLRGWIPVFFGVLLLASLALKFIWRLH